MSHKEKPPSPPTLEEALKLHQTGKISEAILMYQKISEKFPNDYKALHLLGVAKGQQGDWLASIALIEKALALHPSCAEIHCNLGYVLTEIGRYEEALPHFEKSIALQPDYADAHNNWGNTLKKLTHYAEAFSHYKKSIELEPDNLYAHMNCGDTLIELKKYKESLWYFEKTIELKPDFAEAHNSWADALIKLNKYEEAILHYEKSAQLKPIHAEIYNNWGSALFELNRYEEAIIYFEKAITLKPNVAETHNNCGNALKEIKHYKEAISHYEKAIVLKPDYAEAHNNWGNALKELKHYEEAILHYEKAIALKPNYADALFHKSLIYLLAGHFEKGWPLYENRWKRKRANPFPTIPSPIWQGESLAGKKILIALEQGYGDQFQILRYVPLLEKNGAQCLIQTSSNLESLIKRNFKKATVVLSPDKIKPHYWICMMSLPYAFKTFNEQDIPHNCPYLEADLQKTQYWHRQFDPSRKLRVGLSWKGNLKHPKDHTRSVPLETLTPLFSNNDIQFIFLQKDITKNENTTIEKFPNVLSITKGLETFDDTAAAIMALDLVISVDTAIAHLAGALNKKVWVLLPFNPDWRWMLDRRDSPWYPSAKLIRQQHINNWDEVVTEVAQLLKKNFI